MEEENTGNTPSENPDCGSQLEEVSIQKTTQGIIDEFLEMLDKTKRDVKIDAEMDGRFALK